MSANLSKFDIPSLEDPRGEHFLAQYQNKIGYCPLYLVDSYKWMQVRVLGFDAVHNKVIIRRMLLDDIKKVSRLSIRFDSDEHSERMYWERIRLAKKESMAVKEC